MRVGGRAGVGEIGEAGVHGATVVRVGMGSGLVMGVLERGVVVVGNGSSTAAW